MRFKMMLAGCVLVAASAAACAQGGETMAPAKALDAMLSQVEHDMVPAAKAMPADKYGFAPSATTFAAGSPATFVKVRSFADQVVHVAQANYFFYGTVSGMKPDVDMKAMSAIKDKDAAVKALEGSIAFAHKAIATITAENAFVTFKGEDGMNTRATLAAFGVAHAYDHYGQMVEYLRMNGIVPPSSAK
jgi:hypothetical protein